MAKVRCSLLVSCSRPLLSRSGPPCYTTTQCRWATITRKLSYHTSHLGHLDQEKARQRTLDYQTNQVNFLCESQRLATGTRVRFGFHFPNSLRNLALVLPKLRV